MVHTNTFAAPALPAGTFAVMVWESTTVTLVAGVPPKQAPRTSTPPTCTTSPLEKPLPEMVTEVPPAAGPLLGMTWAYAFPADRDQRSERRGDRPAMRMMRSLSP